MKVGDRVKFTGCKFNCPCSMVSVIANYDLIKEFKDQIFIVESIFPAHDFSKQVKARRSNVDGAGIDAFHDEDVFEDVFINFLAVHLSLVKP